MKKIILSFAVLVFSYTILQAQENTVRELSLEDCVQLAIENNITMRSSRIDSEKAMHKVAETRASLLPQVSINGNFQDNLKLQTIMLPGDMIGQPGTSLPVQMGSDFVTAASIGLNQVLYNQTALTGLRLSKLSAELSNLGVEKAGEGIAFEISKLYFLILTSMEQGKLIEDNIDRVKKMKDITKLFVDNGMGKQVDYDRIHVSLENLYTQLSNTEAGIEQQLNMMKYMLNIPLYQEIRLIESSGKPLLATEPRPYIDFSSHTDILLLESQKNIYRTNQKMINDGYLPTLSFTGQFMYQGLRQEFKNYFRSSPENKWYNSSYIGINLSIPIFDGFDKRSKSRQAKLDYQKASITLDDTKEQYSADYINARNNYYNNRSNAERQRENISLAEKVYAETSLKYKEGMASMSDLLQDEMSLSSAQSSYINALYNLKESELKIMSLNGDIKKLINY